MKHLIFIFLTNLCIINLLITTSCSDDDSSTPTEICDDAIDNDGDGFTDCDDLDCDSDPACNTEICDDAIDNDGDGFTDCDDLDCDSFPGC